jgi:hypothetical protein
VSEEVFRGGGVEGELVVRQGEGGILRSGLLEELPAVVEPEVLREGAALEVEVLGLGGVAFGPPEAFQLCTSDVWD